MNKRRRVIVVRTQPAAAATAQALDEIGFIPVVIPLQALSAIKPQPDLRGLTGALVFTSANVFRFLPDDCPREIGPCFCVGDTTANAAIAAGFSDVRSARGDSDHLVSHIKKHWRPSDGTVTHLGHATPRGDIAARLGRAGYDAVHKAIYEPTAPADAEQELTLELSTFSEQTVLVHSPAAASRLRHILENLTTPCRLNVVAISPAAAEPLTDLSSLRIFIADTPDETAMFRLLKTP